ncbi:MAG: hypothetical protein DWQ08_04395 [Proteobacteria bacterium]|nr:MAG: hypothetical protein DWQ08_04395 [Pseudomonadota bacterium]
MVVADIILGSRAEFLNAYSVLQRLVGVDPSAGDSMVAQKLGTVGEFVVVVAVNASIGSILTVLVKVLVSR